jgi:hypothetical protein
MELLLTDSSEIAQIAPCIFFFKTQILIKNPPLYLIKFARTEDLDMEANRYWTRSHLHLNPQ